MEAAAHDVTPEPASSRTPVLARLDCRRRTRCLGAIVPTPRAERRFGDELVMVTPRAEDGPYLDCRACPAYSPEPDAEQRRSDVATLCALAVGAMLDLRRSTVRPSQP